MRGHRGPERRDRRPLRRQVGPAQLRESQQLRLLRLYPGSLVKEPLRTILVPVPKTARVGGVPLRDTAVLRWASDLLRAVVLG